MGREVEGDTIDPGIVPELKRRIVELEATLASIARGRKPCASGSQRVSRDELKTMARDACIRFGIEWNI